ncbi:MAG: helix-turn-helix transcriptional regulator [Oscillospiraceae bacterium]|nr:helix-turn-helix transcriptional regulator [Candidatus Limimonas coprohippi]
MLNENIKTLRRQSGLTQEAFAIRLNVVRQTVSKWEKGLSVPDAQTLQRIAEEFEVPVQELLGIKEAADDNPNAIADQLAMINEQLAIKNRRSANIWKIICFVLIVTVVFLCGKVFSERNHQEIESPNSFFSAIELSNVSFVVNDKEVICSFVPSVGDPDITYSITMHSLSAYCADETVTAQYNNGICVAAFDKSKLSENVEYSTVLSVSGRDVIRNLTVADTFCYKENNCSWQSPWSK